MRSFTERPSESEITVTLSRFGRNRRLVLWFEWLTLWPTRADLPVRSQRRDMVVPLKTCGAIGAPEMTFFVDRGRIETGGRGVKVSGRRETISKGDIIETTHSPPRPGISGNPPAHCLDRGRPARQSGYSL